MLPLWVCIGVCKAANGKYEEWRRIDKGDKNERKLKEA
jgi:hypothetical protein